MRSVRHIERGGYHAIDWLDDAGLTIADLWQRFPELVVGRYLVNTSFDSGPLTLSDAEREEGWRMIGQLAHSPAIRSIKQIPHDQYDEWLVFKYPTQVTAVETMVNFGGFSPVDFDWEEKREWFWTQVVRLSPLHVIAENLNIYLTLRAQEGFPATYSSEISRKCSIFIPRCVR